MAKIVVGVDGSGGAQAALHWALAEARLRGAQLHVVHAWMVPFAEAVPEPWAIGVHAPGPPVEEVYERLREEAQKLLDASAREAVEDDSIDVRLDLVEGRAAQALVEAAGDAALLVVGSRGRGGFAGLLLGSVSQQCAQHAPCPLVIVPTGPGDARGP